MMLKELPEFLQEPSDEEWADVMIMWLDVAHLLGIDPVKAIISKMIINCDRKFELDESLGTYEHIKQDPGSGTIS